MPKDIANNITCPACGSDECYVNEKDGWVKMECKDCGLEADAPANEGDDYDVRS